MTLPAWAAEAVALYESNAASQFILSGNVNDRLPIPADPATLGDLSDFLLRVLMPRFDVGLSYDVGHGIRVEKGGAVPMGYLLCGPVGTGKTFLVECLAGEAGIPVIKLEYFRDRWVGSTEANLEKIFRLLHGLGRCGVFVDEADQSLGRRTTDGDAGVSGRVYAMMAEEMGDPANRGRVRPRPSRSRCTATSGRGPSPPPCGTA